MSEGEALIARNPILAGCYPDPSICRVGDDYYLTTSTFEYFPGLPIFHSRDLANWTQVGHVIDRDGQLDYEGIRSSGGLYAPTIRHDDAKFWVMCTLVAHEGRHPGGNFIVTASDISGPWSDPVWFDVEGIDPSVFFDDDGSAWLHGTRLVADPQWPSQTETWMRKFDLESASFSSPEYVVWNGAVRDAVWSEAPHIYKVDGFYYLINAEGGTDFHHAVTVARSKSITGPYVGAPTNPIFTHRHFGAQFPIVGAGHADLVQAADGSWWATLLAMRRYGGYHYNLGRETFLVPVQWQDGWPVFAPGIGQLSETVEVPAGVSARELGEGEIARLHDPNRGGVIPPADLRWTTLRGPIDFAEQIGKTWRLQMRPTTMIDRGRPTFVGVRQQHLNARATARVAADLEPGEEFGVIVRQSEDDHVRCAVSRSTGGLEVVVTHRQGGVDEVLVRERRDADVFEFEITAQGQEYRVGVTNMRADDSPAIDAISATFDGRTLDSVTTGGFLGLWFGVYATSNGRPTETKVDLQRFAYEQLPELES